MRRVLIALACLMPVGCGSTGVLRVGNAKAPAKPEGCPIAVFAEEKDVGRPFEKLCLIDAKTGSTLYNDRSTGGAMKKVNRAACECGADAVIVQGMQKKGVSLASWGSAAVSVLAIRYKDATPSDPVYLTPETKLFDPSGALYGEVIETVLGRKSLDGSVQDSVQVKKANGERVWIALSEALKLRAEAPAPSPAAKE